MSELRAWAAGFFESRGTITTNEGKPVLRVSSSNREAIEKFVQAIGVGHVVGPYFNRGSEARDGYERAGISAWVCPRAHVDDVYAALAPWLSKAKNDRARELGIRFHVKTRRAR